MNYLTFSRAVVGVLLASSMPLVHAHSAKDFLGSWYTETKENKQIGGKPYDIRREVLDNRIDGTKTNVFRYYSAGTLVDQAVVTYTWGVEKGIYWTVCHNILANSELKQCSGRTEYDIVAVTPKEIRYTSRKSGQTYTIRRVNHDFRLP